MENKNVCFKINQKACNINIQNFSIFLFILLFSGVIGFSQTGTVADIPLPAGYKRIEVAKNSFGNYLRQIELKSDKTVYLFHGQKKKINQYNMRC